MYTATDGSQYTFNTATRRYDQSKPPDCPSEVTINSINPNTSATVFTPSYCLKTPPPVTYVATDGSRWQYDPSKVQYNQIKPPDCTGSVSISTNNPNKPETTFSPSPQCVGKDAKKTYISSDGSQWIYDSTKGYYVQIVPQTKVCPPTVTVDAYEPVYKGTHATNPTGCLEMSIVTYKARDCSEWKWDNVNLKYDLISPRGCLLTQTDWFHITNVANDKLVTGSMRYAIADSTKPTGYSLSATTDVVTFEITCDNGFKMDLTKPRGSGSVVFDNAKLWRNDQNCYVMKHQTESDAIGIQMNRDCTFQCRFSKPVSNIVLAIHNLGGNYPRTLASNNAFEIISKNPNTTSAMAMSSQIGWSFALSGFNGGCIKFTETNQTTFTCKLFSTADDFAKFPQSTLILFGVDCCGNVPPNYKTFMNTTALARPSTTLSNLSKMMSTPTAVKPSLKRVGKSRDYYYHSPLMTTVSMKNKLLFSTPDNQEWQWNGNSYSLRQT
jgi:hypothetical protein